jgi:hypothetical protein
MPLVSNTDTPIKISTVCVDIPRYIWSTVTQCHCCKPDVKYLFTERIAMSCWASVWTGHTCLQATMQRLFVPGFPQRTQTCPASHFTNFLSLVTTPICSHKMRSLHPVRVTLAITVRCALLTGTVLQVDLVHPTSVHQVRKQGFYESEVCLIWKGNSMLGFVFFIVKEYEKRFYF